MCGCSSGVPYWGPGHQPRHVPWLGIKPARLWFTGWYSIHWATPARAEKNIIKYHIYFPYFKYFIDIFDKVEQITPGPQCVSSINIWLIIFFTKQNSIVVFRKQNSNKTNSIVFFTNKTVTKLSLIKNIFLLNKTGQVCFKKYMAIFYALFTYYK